MFLTVDLLSYSVFPLFSHHNLSFLTFLTWYQSFKLLKLTRLPQIKHELTLISVQTIGEVFVLLAVQALQEEEDFNHGVSKDFPRSIILSNVQHEEIY